MSEDICAVCGEPQIDAFGSLTHSPEKTDHYFSPKQSPAVQAKCPICKTTGCFHFDTVTVQPAGEKCDAQTIIDALNRQSNEITQAANEMLAERNVQLRNETVALKQSNETLLKRIEELEGRLKIGENLFVDLGTEYGMEKAYRQDLEAQLSEANKAVEWVNTYGPGLDHMLADITIPGLPNPKAELRAILAAKTKGEEKSG